MKIKQYIKYYKYNNLPEILFLVGVFILSLGLSLRVESGSILGIYFYKSDLRSITTISKILGMVIISLGIIMNLKKYTNKEKGPKFITDEEKNKESNKEIKIDVAKTEAYLKKTGGFINVVGWLTLIINTAVYFWNRFNGEIVLNSVFLIIFTITIIYIILGARIKNLNDVKTKLYLNLVAISSIIFGVLVVYSGGRIGLLFFFLIGYLLISLNKINKAMKVKEFYSKLSKKKYQINKNIWIVLFIVFSVLFTFFIIRDIKIINSDVSNIDLEQEYETDKPDLSYEGYLKEKNASSGVYDELDKQKIIPSVKTETNIINTSNTSNWAAYNFEDNKFSILFPVNPKVDIWKDTNENINTPLRMNTYLSISESLNLAFHVETITNKSGDFIPEDTDSFLSETFNLISSFGVDKNYDLISSNYGYLNDKRVFNFLTKEKNGTFSKKGIILFNKDTSYIITMLYDNGDNNEEIYNKFINSFKILK